MTKQKHPRPDPSTEVQASFAGKLGAVKPAKPLVAYKDMLAPANTAHTAESARRLRNKVRSKGAEIPAHLE